MAYKPKHCAPRRKEEDELEHAYRGMTSRRRSTKKKSVMNNTAAVIAICSVVILLAVGILIASILIANSNNGTILENVYVAGVDVGGMTQSEAINAVNASAAERYETIPMVITVLDSQIELPAEYAGKLDVKGAVKAAFDYGRKGSSSDRKKAKETAASAGYVVDLSPYLDLDKKAIKAALEQLGQSYSSTLLQTTWEVIGDVPSFEDIQAGKNLQKLVIHLGIPEYGLDLDALYHQVLDAYSANVFTITGSCGTIDPDEIDLQKILDEYYIAPEDAHLDPDTGDIVAGKQGYGFDLQTATTLLAGAEYGATLEVPFISIDPEVTTQDLTNQIYRDVLATYTASADSDPDRNVNLRLACEAIDGLVLQPNEVFSYNAALGERTEERGYRPGPSYAGNQTVYTIGGGICQVSSALYYCTLMADLEIVLRECHSYAQTYVPLGMDATVSWGYLDFRFRNNMEYPIRIEASANGSSVTIRILGTDERDYYVKMEYEIINEYPSSTTYKTMSADNPEGYKNGDYIVTPYKGYDIKTYRCKYNKQTDELISKEPEAVSDYKKRDGIICEIVGSPSTDPGNQGIGGSDITDGTGDLPPE